MTTTTTRQVTTLDLPLGPGRQTLRLALVEAGREEPATLVLSIGFGGAHAADFMRPSWGDLPLRVPADKIPEFVEALQELRTIPEEQP